MITITCKIPEELNGCLESEARRRHVRKSDLVRDALEKAVRRGRSGRSVSAYDVAKRLCGSLHGPADLSTNPKYMEGYGS